MKTFFEILEKVIYAVLLCVAVLLVLSILPLPGGPKMFVVLSGSMEPTIHTGAVVVEVPESSYKVGDVVTFGKDTRVDIPTTHRLVASRAQEGVLLFSTKGDANNSPDGTEIRQSDIHGKVLFSIPYLGYIIDFVKKPIGLVLIIVLPALFIIGDEIRKIIGEIKKMRKEKVAGDDIKK